MKELLKEVYIALDSLRAVQRNKCYMCGRFMANTVSKAKGKTRFTMLSKDHIVPYSHLRNRMHANIVLACRYCNTNRHDEILPPHLFRKSFHIRLAAIAYQLTR